MNIKIFTLSFLVAIFLTDAVEVTDEDINSPLVSYLLAKVQRLESQIMVRPHIWNTRQTTEKPILNHLLLLLTINSVTVHPV